MPKTPQVNFTVQNNNVEVNTPLLGVTHVIARTTKGEFESPSVLINSYPQFESLFGKEIVPDGSISNIQKAFELGSRIRVSRVKGSGNISKGTSVAPMVMYLTIDGQEVVIKVSIETKEYGSPIVNPDTFNANSTFWLMMDEVTGFTSKIYLSQLRADPSDNPSSLDPSSFISKDQVVSYVSGSKVDSLSFRSFVESVPNLHFYINPEIQTYQGVKSMEDVYNLLDKSTDINIHFGTGTDDVTTITEGNNGGDISTDVQWKSAFDALQGYDDAYQLIASHIHQHITIYNTVYKYIRDAIHGKYGIVLYVEVPKTFVTVDTIVAQLQTMVGVIGYSQNVAYFAGGLKYYDSYGVLKDCDVLGTVVGLGDASATVYGPWYSFSGMNRGIVPDAIGPVMENLGGPNKMESLQTLADYNCNLFVIKNTRTTGLRTMLWHGFTSTSTSDSEKFLATERLLIYIKKNLVPILESYLEEPNTFSTWMNIYLEGKQVMDALVDNNAIERYSWQGDQDKTSFDDLQINTEAEVRQGKYRIHLNMREIVPLQDISFVLTLDAANSTIGVNVN